MCSNMLYAYMSIIMYMSYHAFQLLDCGENDDESVLYLWPNISSTKGYHTSFTCCISQVTVCIIESGCIA